MSTAAWLQRHRVLARAMHRVPVLRRWLAARVWREAEADPEFVASLNAGLADLAAGRRVAYAAYRGNP